MIKEIADVKAISEQNDSLYERERLTAKETIRQQNQQITSFKLDVTIGAGGTTEQWTNELV